MATNCTNKDQQELARLVADRPQERIAAKIEITHTELVWPGRYDEKGPDHQSRTGDET